MNFKVITMRKILFLSYLFMPFMLLAQSKDCKYKMKYDEFEKTTSYSFQNKSFPNLGYHIYFYKKEDDFAGAFILFSVMGKGGCTSSGSYVSFMFEDSEIKRYNYTGEIDCGTTMISITLNKDDLELLSSKRITKIRISFDYPKDYDISEKGYVKFSENINCLLSTL